MRGARSGLAALLVGAAIPLGVGLRPLGAQKDEVPTEQAGKLILRYNGVAACQRCHTNPLKDDPALCRLTEVPHWLEKDKHADAWLTLLSPRAQKMGELLGYKQDMIPILAPDHKGLLLDSKTKEPQKRMGYATINEPACLNCHGVHVKDKSTKGATFKPEEGVSCSVCHGNYENWFSAHYSDADPANEKWRKTPRSVKETSYGMRDLWDPVNRTKLCVSCHVGNTREGKFVTHAMYAAGHPPLPSIEIGLFSEEMPRHWDYPGEKPDKIRGYQGLSQPEYNFERSRLVLLGGLTTLRESVNLAVEQAKKDDLDFAVFDCYACHHELKGKSWRVDRGYRGKPGRPQMPEWPAALARANLRAMGHSDKLLDDTLKPLYRAFDKRPFGDPASVKEEGQVVVDAIDKWTVAARKHPVDQEVAKKLLNELASSLVKDKPDYDSARQLIWGAMMVGLDARGQRHRKGHDSYLDLKSTVAYDQLNKVLKLSLPATRANKLEDDLPRALKKRGEYHPDSFKAEFQKLLQELKTPGVGSK